MRRPKQLWKQLWKSMGSIAGRSWQRMRPYINPRRLSQKFRSQQIRENMPNAGILVGAVAFGLWWQNLGAAIFGGIGLSFLAGIYKATRRMHSEFELSGNGSQFRNDADRLDGTPENSDELKRAISTLKPWLANTVTLTEEDAKQCCEVLVDSVVERAKGIQSSENFARDAWIGNSWR